MPGIDGIGSSAHVRDAQWKILLFALDTLLPRIKEITEDYYRVLGDEHIATKDDGSLVSACDKEIEIFIKSTVSEKFGDDRVVLGEEIAWGDISLNAVESVKGALVERKRYLWIVDPIDGTSSFLTSRPLFMTLIGVLEESLDGLSRVLSRRPVLGMLYQPILDELYVGGMDASTYREIIDLDGDTGKLKDPDVFSGGMLVEDAASTCYFPMENACVRDVKTSTRSSLSDCYLATTSPELLSVEVKGCFETLAKEAKAVVYGGDAYNYCAAGSGSIDIVIEGGLKVYDILTPALFVVSCGGCVIDNNGNDFVRLLLDGQISRDKEYHVVACANAELLKDVRRLGRV